MALATGTRLGPYEILSPAGAGGMGEVYRARDTRLDRIVAIKVLPAHLSEDPVRRQRFETEARAVSKLSHPHICTLYDVGREGGIDFLVMEFLEGETLANRLARGALPPDQVLRHGIEIATALDKAHRQGIVHRDLKPANIILTRSGAKLLDFGLAKDAAGLGPGFPGGPAPATAMATATQGLPLTAEGTIVGTMQYMAPEQLEGREVDARTDIFAFGVVLYEMATARRAFPGTSHASLISAIMQLDPAPISTIQPKMPPALDRLVRTCLEKNPDDRWQSAQDIARELRWIAGGSQAGVAAPPAARTGTRERISWALTAVALLVAAAAVAVYGRPTATSTGPIRTSIILQDKTALRGLAISPDSRRLAFVARDSSGKNLLWVRPLDSLAVQALPGTENPSFPFWSPDSRFLGFFAEGKLKKIDISGGPPQTLCDAPINRGGTWNQDGVIVFAPVPDGPLFRVSAGGGPPTQLTRFDPLRAESSHRWPFFLPDGRHYLYLVASFGGHKERTGVYAGSLDSKDETFLLQADSNVAYAPPGYLLFFREGNLMAVPFDTKGPRITGDPVPIAEEIQYFPQTYDALFSVSRDGMLLYQGRTAAGLSQLVWFDRGGRRVGTLGSPADQVNPRISPDGKRVALDRTDPQTGNMDIWIYEPSGGVATRLTSHTAIDEGPVWSPDGKKIVFMSIRASHPDLYQRSSGGEGREEPILESETAKYPTDWSPDGRLILYRAIGATTNLELWVLPTDGDRKAVPFIKTTFGVSYGQFSPDGRWVAYSSNETGQWEIYVAPFPGPGGNWKVSSAGGTEPRWRRDGKELFYIAPDGRLMALDVKVGASFEADAARPLFQTGGREHISSGDLFTYDVAADGQRFLVNTDVGEVVSPSPTVVLDWAAELKR
jgi:Tol biopolymer transport system component/predicted Ser/Thr protein kinase